SFAELLRGRTARYGFSFLSVYCAVVLTHGTADFFKIEAFDFFQGAVFLTAWLGGLGPGLLAAALSIVAMDYLFIPPINTLSCEMADLLRLTIFGGVAILTSFLSGQLKMALTELRKSRDELEIRVRERTNELSYANENLKKEMAQRLEAEKEALEISNQE